jgi:hypothetical protein
MIVTLTVDSREWENAVGVWNALAHREGVSANLEAAQKIQDRVRRLLDEGEHAAGTKSPKPPGTAPGSISGSLAASVEARHDGDDALVGPTGSASSDRGPYGRFLELGGTHTASRGAGGYYHGEWVDHLMWFSEDGRRYKSPEITKAPRPYLKPATDDAIASGEITEIYARHWLVAQEAVTS